MTPVLRKTPTGWLAVSSPDDEVRIGVPGATEEEALAQFREAGRAWAELAQRAREDPVGAE